MIKFRLKFRDQISPKGDQNKLNDGQILCQKPLKGGHISLEMVTFVFAHSHQNWALLVKEIKVISENGRIHAKSVLKRHLI